MATRGKKQEEVKTAPDAEEVLYIETADDLTQALSKVYAEAGTTELENDALAHVSIVEPDGTDAKIWKGSPSDYDLDKLAREHGSGNYRLMVYVKDESGQYRRKLNKVFTYRLSAEADARLRAIRKGEPISASAGGNGATNMTPQDIIKLVQETMRTQQPAAIDPLVMVDKLAGIVGKMVQPQATGVGGGGMRDVLDMSRSLLTLVKDLRGDDGGNVSEKPADRALARGIDVIARMFENHMDGKARPAIQPKNGETVQEVQLTAEQQEQLEDIRMALRFTVRAAKAGDDPATFADEWYEEVPLQVIADMMTNPQWFDAIAANASDAAKHKEWFLKVREALIGIAVKEGHLTPDGKIVEDQPDGGADKGTGTGGATAE